MRFFDRIELDKLDRRDWQLWLLAISMIVILGSGVAVLMYPSVFGAAPGTGGQQPLQRTFFAFCVLNFLFVVYVLDRQMAIRRLRRRLREEQKRNTDLRARASSDLIRSLPNFAHFQDRLAMQFRRAANSREALSLLLVHLKPSATLAPAEVEIAYGDAVKVMLRKLRSEDSIYMIHPGLFGILLPGLAPIGAGSVAGRLGESLTDVAGAETRFTFETEVVSYPDHVSAAYDMEEVARSRLAAVDEPEPAVA